MHRIACMVDDTSALACTCRYLRAISSEVASGLLPTLHPHQRAALKRMAERERNPMPLAHCYVLRMPLLPVDGMHAYVNCVSGDVSLHAPNAYEDIQGGLFCDDPGLGKTVTALALITNSLGVVPAPPKGAKARRGSFHDSYREVSGSFYMAPLSELLEKSGIDEAEGTAAGHEGRGSQGGEGVDHATPKRRASTRARTSIVVLPNNSKARAVAQQGIKRQGRNLKVLEDLNLTPTKVGDSGKDMPHAHPRDDSIASARGFVRDSDDFRGEQPENIRYFRDLIVSFCHEHDVSPDALHSLPAVEVLLGRLQSRNHTTAHSTARSKSYAAIGCQSSTQARPHSCIQCCPSHALRVPLVKYQLRQWAQTHLPTATQRTFAARSSPAKPASMSEGAANAGTCYSQKFLSALGLVPGDSTAASPTAIPAKKRVHNDDDDNESYAATKPKKSWRSSLNITSHPRDHASGASSSQLPSSTVASTGFSFPKRIQRDVSIRFDAPALVQAFVEASVEYRRNADSEPVMLSPATLVVVPAILVEHWKHEIAKHVKHALLRVYCIEDARSADIPAHQLAWDYDVVLTTFSHLSAYGATWQLRSREARHAILQVPGSFVLL